MERQFDHSDTERLYAKQLHAKQLHAKRMHELSQFKGKTFVIKYGGSIMDRQAAQEAFIEDLLHLTGIGINIIIVHGGGPEISRWLSKAGIESRFIKGLRVTDSDTMEVVEMVLSGSVNKRLSANLSRKGLKALGLSGRDSGLLTAEKKYLLEGDERIDLGYVGDITDVKQDILQELLSGGFTPVISPIGCDAAGNSYNINADYAAGFISGALKAEKLLILTDIDGVYLDIKDPSSILPSITVDEIRKYSQEGIITGGMLPKLDCCINALAQGTKSVHLIDGRKEHGLLTNLMTNNGTKIIYERENEQCQ